MLKIEHYTDGLPLFTKNDVITLWPATIRDTVEDLVVRDAAKEVVGNTM